MFFENLRDSARYVHRGDCVCAPHFHQSVELLAVLSGEKEVVINSVRLELRAGEVLVCMPYAVHEYLPSEGEQVCTAIPPASCAEFFAATERLSLKNNPLERGEGTQELIGFMLQLTGRRTPLYERGLVNCIFGLVLELGTFVPQKKREKDFVRQILEYVEEHYRENLTLEATAEHFGYSKYYFSKLFNAHFFFHFSAYVNQVRIFKSLPLLKKYKLSTVYDECGFNNPQQYFLNFKKYIGKTPREYLAEEG